LGVALALWRQTHPLPVSPQHAGSDAPLTDPQIAAAGKGADSPATAPALTIDETKPIVPSGSQ
jgi:hypothetical protein